MTCFLISSGETFLLERFLHVFSPKNMNDLNKGRYKNFGIPRKWREPGQVGRIYTNCRECTQIIRCAKILPEVYKRDHSCSFLQTIQTLRGNCLQIWPLSGTWGVQHSGVSAGLVQGVIKNILKFLILNQKSVFHKLNKAMENMAIS